MSDILSDELYVKHSLDINLFFLRIMKEHALFMTVAFPPKYDDLIQSGKDFNKQFNDLLTKAASIAYKVQGIKNDAVTNYTLDAEKATSFVTGFPIDTNLTEFELSLVGKPFTAFDSQVIDDIYRLNNLAIQTTKNFITYKTRVLDVILSCKIFNANYPLLIDHIRREAFFFVDLLTKLQEKVTPNVVEEMIRQQIFWNRIMSKHAKFIHGLLDPTEEELMDIAANFGDEFNELNEKAIQMSNVPQVLPQITEESIELTKGIQGFKTQGTEGLIQCKIRSIILPLLGDHTIREANHYLNLLQAISFN